MGMILVHIEVTNTVNDNKQVAWKEFIDEDEAKNYIKEQEDAVNEWNTPGPGKMSIRWISAIMYSIEDLSKLTLEELKDMPVSTFVKVLKEL